MAIARMQERKKLSTGMLIIFFMIDITMIKNRVEKIAKAKGVSMARLSLAWIMSQNGMCRSIRYSLSLFLIK